MLALSRKRNTPLALLLAGGCVTCTSFTRCRARACRWICGWRLIYYALTYTHTQMKSHYIHVHVCGWDAVYLRIRRTRTAAAAAASLQRSCGIAQSAAATTTTKADARAGIYIYTYTYMSVYGCVSRDFHRTRPGGSMRSLSDFMAE